MNKQIINEVEQEANEAMYEHAMSHRFTKRSHDRRFDRWEAQVDEEILQYLKLHAEDEFDPDGSIYSKAQKWVNNKLV